MENITRSGNGGGCLIVNFYFLQVYFNSLEIGLISCRCTDITVEDMGNIEKFNSMEVAIAN